VKKILLTLVLVLSITLLQGFTFVDETESGKSEYSLNLDNLYEYQKTYSTIEIELCGVSGSTKTYMDYRATTNVTSRQYKFMREELTVDTNTGFLYDEDGFIGAALGSYFGEIGDRFYFTLDSGIVLPIVKCEGKADAHTDGSNCFQSVDGSIIEFVIDTDLARQHFGTLSNGYVLNGNFNNYSTFKGQIVKAEKVTNKKNDTYVTYGKNKMNINNKDIYFYASGY